MKIVTDSSVMFSVAEGVKHGLTVLPLTVTINNKHWLEYEEISAEEFLQLVRAGDTPQSASPPPALILEAYNTEEEVLHIAMADGLSGAYEVACGLKEQAKHPERVRVLNSRTLCVPHRALAEWAVELAGQGKTMPEVTAALENMIESIHSYLIPEDFDFLQRGGRLTPLAAKAATLLKAVPVMRQTEDGTRLEKLTVTRAFGKSIAAITKDLEAKQINKNFFIGVSHADNLEQASFALTKIQEHFPQCRSELFELSPAFITQGGPGCIAIQVVDLSPCPNLQLTH